jgi:hypothetical protein
VSKRLTDSRKWDDEWFLELSLKHKMLWLYILDKCDHAGFFKPNMKLATFCIGEKITLEEMKTVFKDRIYESGSKWFIPKFITFQYGELSSDSAFHRKIISILDTNRVSTLYRQGINTLKEEIKDKDKYKEKELNNSQKYFYDTYLKTFNALYVANFGKDGKLFKEMNKVISEKDLMSKIDKFMSSKDEFIVKAGYTVGVFYSQINKLNSSKKVERGDI